ncbi:NUDIX hydrolase [Candidatus Peregrinibacteria bacterium]|nr:MAG: NUDIX hydrolase [Candidatus Peregrinibacteria bacterium]
MKIAVRALIQYAEKILLVKHINRDFYSLPGGKINEGESLITALRRELKEELGVESRGERMAYVHEFLYPGATETSLEFFFSIGNPEAFLTLQKGTHTDEEIHEAIWVKPTDDLALKPEFLKKNLENRPDTIEFVSRM